MPASWAAKLWTMKTIPIGRMNAAIVLVAAAVVAARASSPRGATIAASENPITAWAERARTIGQARESSAR